MIKAFLRWAKPIIKDIVEEAEPLIKEVVKSSAKYYVQKELNKINKKQ